MGSVVWLCTSNVLPMLNLLVIIALLKLSKISPSRIWSDMERDLVAHHMIDQPGSQHNSVIGVSSVNIEHLWWDMHKYYKLFWMNIIYLALLIKYIYMHCIVYFSLELTALSPSLIAFCVGESKTPTMPFQVIQYQKGENSTGSTIFSPFWCCILAILVLYSSHMTLQSWPLIFQWPSQLEISTFKNFQLILRIQQFLHL